MSMADISRPLRFILMGVGALLSLALLYLVIVWPKDAARPLGELHFVQSPEGERVACYLDGPEDGQPVIMLASLGRSVGDFNALQPHLVRAGYRTIAVDMPGIGKSGTPVEAAPTLYSLAALIDAAVTDAGIPDTESLIVIGHAFGNRLARAYASERAERIDRIILIAAGGAQDLNKMPKVQSALTDSFAWWMPPPMRKADVKYAFFADANNVPRDWMNGWYADGARHQATAVRRTPEGEWRTGGDRPILILQADSDRIAPAAKTSAVIKDAKPDLVSIVLIENAGHALLPEQPDRIASEVLTFLKKDTAE
ncbi:alpha/beta fold hydrolase [Parvularcula marina]|uniref:alpha/beta fold hydrolase n=1 Tax=Parvularcula marina TaxID=2292771 RepID=UPI003510FAFE